MEKKLSDMTTDEINSLGFSAYKNIDILNSELVKNKQILQMIYEELAKRGEENNEKV